MSVKIIDNSVTPFRLEPSRASIQPMQQPQSVVKPLPPANVNPRPIKSVTITDETFKPEPPRESIRPVPTSMPSYENDLVNHQIGSLLTCNDLLQQGKYPIAELYLNRPLTGTEKMDQSLTGPILKFRPRPVPAVVVPANTPQLTNEIVVNNPVTGETKVTPGGADLTSLDDLMRNNPRQRELRMYSKEVLRTYLQETFGIQTKSNNRDEIIRQLRQAVQEDSGLGKMFEQDDDDEKSIQGSGLGLKTPKYAQIGSFSINIQKINAAKPKLSVYYTQSGARVVYFHPAPTISQQFVALLKHYLVKNQVHSATYKRLNPNEKELWDKLITRSQGGQIRKRIVRPAPQLASKTYNFATEPLPPFATNIKDKAQRLTLVLGQIDARGGQNTDDLTDEAVKLAKSLLASKTITKKEYEEVIQSLS